jgi:hypothetical protein
MTNFVWVVCGTSQIVKLPPVIAASIITVMINPFFCFNLIWLENVVYNGIAALKKSDFLSWVLFYDL